MTQTINVPGQGPVAFPDNMSDDQIVAAIKGMSAPSPVTDNTTSTPLANARDIALGAVKGAANIGSTILWPWDKANDLIKGTEGSNDKRRQEITDALVSLGADPKQVAYKLGTFGGELAGTAGVAPAAGTILRSAVPALAPLANAVRSGGFSLGTPAATTLAPKLINAGTRLTGAGVAGGLTAGAVDPEQAIPGATIGVAIPVVGKTLSAIGSTVGNVARPLINPAKYATSQLADKLGPDLSTIIPQLQSTSNEIVPGSLPTAAQVASSPVLTQMEKSVANSPDFVQRTLQNNNARWQAIRDVAGQPGDLEAAVEARKIAAEQAYGTAFANGPDPNAMTPWLKGQVTQLLKRPAMQDAIGAAQLNLANSGKAMTNSTSIEGLHSAKLALDDQINKAISASDGSKNAKNALQGLYDTRTKLLDVLDRMSPDYAAARAQYATQSGPINTMQAGADIGTSLSQLPMDVNHNPIITLPAYRGAFKSAIKGADYGIDPAAAQSLGNVGADLQRATTSNGPKIPSTSPIEAQGWLARALYGRNFQGAGLLGKAVGATAGTVIPGIGTLGGWLGAPALGKTIGEKINTSLLSQALNPGELGNALQGVSTPGTLSRVGALLRNPNVQPALLAAPEVAKTSQ